MQSVLADESNTARMSNSAIERGDLTPPFAGARSSARDVAQRCAACCRIVSLLRCTLLVCCCGQRGLRDQLDSSVACSH